MKKDKNRILKIILFVSFFTCLILSGCGRFFDVNDLEKANKTYNPNSDDTIISVGVSQVGSESVWRTANTASIQDAISRINGYFLIFDNARQKQENQIKAIRSFISRQVDYIVFSPITETGWDTVLQEAKDAGIPVILMDRQVDVSDESLYTAWVGSDFYEEGKKAGEWLEEYEIKHSDVSENTLNIVVLKGTEGSSSVIGRTDGFYDIAKEHENWNILASVDADYTTARAEEEMTELLQKYDDIDVVVSQNDDMTFGAIEAIKEAGLTPGIEGDVVLISFDATRAALELVRQGIIGVDVECNPLLGASVSEIIKAHERGGGYSKLTYVSEMSFTIDNVDQYIENRTY